MESVKAVVLACTVRLTEGMGHGTICLKAVAHFVLLNSLFANRFLLFTLITS